MVKIGVGVIIINQDQKVLLGKRKSSHGEGCWGFPGGHLDANETPIDCAIRETREETGLELFKVSTGPWTNDIFPDGKHYITLFTLATHRRGTPHVMEPDKCERWEWFNWSSLPTPLFLPIISLQLQGFSFENYLKSAEVLSAEIHV